MKDAKTVISELATKDIIEELKGRRGVEIKIAEPYQHVEINNVIGPAIVLIVTD